MSVQVTPSRAIIANIQSARKRVEPADACTNTVYARDKSSPALNPILDSTDDRRAAAPAGLEQTQLGVLAQPFVNQILATRAVAEFVRRMRPQRVALRCPR